MLKLLGDRWDAKSSKIGKVFHTWIAGILGVCSALGMANDYLSVIPPDYIPTWLKTVVVVSGVISFVGGKLTKETNVQPKN